MLRPLEILDSAGRTAIIAGLLCIALAACVRKDVQPADAGAVEADAPIASREPWHDQTWDADFQRYVNVYTDGENGCQWWATGTAPTLTFTPRRNRDGTQVCGVVKTGEAQ